MVNFGIIMRPLRVKIFWKNLHCYAALIMFLFTKWNLSALMTNSSLKLRPLRHARKRPQRLPPCAGEILAVSFGQNTYKLSPLYRHSIVVLLTPILYVNWAKIQLIQTFNTPFYNLQNYSRRAELYLLTYWPRPVLPPGECKQSSQMPPPLNGSHSCRLNADVKLWHNYAPSWIQDILKKFPLSCSPDHAFVYEMKSLLSDVDFIT